MLYGTSTGYLRGGGLTKGDLSDVYVSGSFDDTATFGGISLQTQELRSLYVARINDIPVGAPEVDSGSEELLIYPNPTDNLLFIQYKNPEASGRVQVQVKNAMGQLVHSNVYNSFRSVLQISIDLGAHPKGVYFVELDSGSKKFIKKVVVN
jgi:hypothetical protein